MDKKELNKISNILFTNKNFNLFIVGIQVQNHHQ